MVVKGFTQRPCFDFSDTFSLVVKATTIRIIIALAVHHNWPLDKWQVDINNAFLHGDLTKLVFMQQPPSFENATTPTYVRKLNKALYGLKQAPWAYFTKLTSTLTMWDFTASKSDSSLMIYASKGNLFSYLLKLMTELSQGTTINLFQSSSMIFITNLHSKIWASFITFLGLK